MKSKLEQINKLISEMEDEVPDGERLELELDYFEVRTLTGAGEVLIKEHTLKAKLVREVEL